MQILFGVLGLAASAATQASAASYGVTSGRAQSLVALALGVLGIVLGARALRGAPSRGAASVGVLAGLLGAGLGGLRVATAGPIGTGSGRLGAIVAVVVGLIGMALGGLALARRARCSR